MMLGGFATTFLALAGSQSDAQVQQPAAPPIRQVDHIMIRTGDPGELYTFFTEILRLPVAWPMATRGGVTSGGVGFGNVNVEAIQIPGQKTSQPQLVGFGFEPSPLRECLASLDRRGDQLWCTTSRLLQRAERINPDTLYKCHSAAVFRHGRPCGRHDTHLSERVQPHVCKRRATTRAGAQRVGGQRRRTTWRGFDERNRRRRQRSAGNSRALAETVGPAPTIGAEHMAGSQRAGHSPRSGRAEFGSSSGNKRLVIAAGSHFPAENGLLGSDSTDEITIDPSKLYGLNVRLVAKQ